MENQGFCIVVPFSNICMIYMKAEGKVVPVLSQAPHHDVYGGMETSMQS